MVGTDREMLDICEALFKWRAVERLSKDEPIIEILVNVINDEWDRVKGKLENAEQ